MRKERSRVNDVVWEIDKDIQIQICIILGKVVKNIARM